MMGVFVQLNEGKTGKGSTRSRLHPVGYVIEESGCWSWVGYLNADGYGIWEGMLASRKMFAMANGPIPKGRELDHLCRNRACINPAHLESVSHKENCLRGESFSARNAQKTHCKRGHEYSGANLYVHKGGRRCLECDRIQKAKQYARGKDDRSKV